VTTVKTTLPVAFTGTNAATLPQFIHALPVTSPVRRYVAASLPASQVGVQQAQWTDLVGTAHYTQATTAKRPTLRQTGAIRYIEFDNVDDTLTGPAFQASGYCAFSVVRFRRAANAGYWPAIDMNSGNTVFQLGTDGRMVGFAPGLTPSTPVIPGTAWHVFMLQANGSAAGASFLRMDDTEIAWAHAPQAVGVPRIAVTGASGTTIMAAMDVAEQVVYSRALTADERNSTVAALRAAYSI
jgi:hypothetical protein